MKKRRGRDIFGILLLDKPQGFTSNDALQKIKRIFKANKAGHTGSLDPLATGMLPICFGDATKFSRYLLEADKQYHVVVKLGVSTDSGDSDGQVISTNDVPTLTEADIETVLARFRGDLKQIPSMFSAIKYQGKPLYEYARSGITVEREPRSITIKQLDLLDFQHDRLSLFVHASKGTYIRTLVQDIGDVLGCGAHVTALRRETVGGFTGQMHTLAELEQLAENDDAALLATLLPAEMMLEAMPEVEVSEAAVFYLAQGQAVILPNTPDSGLLRLKLRGKHFIGVGEVLPDGRLTPRKIVRQLVE